MDYLAKLKKELREKAKRFEELRSVQMKESLTDEQVSEKRDLFSVIKDLGEKIDVEIEERKLLNDLNDPINDPPAGGDPNKGSGITVTERPVYRSFGEQVSDIITLGTPGASKVEARSRLEKAEKQGDTEKRAAGVGQIVGVGSDGGAFVQTDFATDLFQKGFSNGSVLPKTQKRTLSGNSNSVEIMGIDEDSRATGSRNGGVRVYTKAELEQYESSKAKFNSIEIKVDKITGLLFLSDEIFEDAAFLEGEVSGLFVSEFDFKLQDLLFHGLGAGEPLGIMNCNALVTVAKEGSQAADTIVTGNISKMKARVAGGRAEWYANRDTIPQLDALYRTIGSNNVTPLFKQTSIYAGILDGIPITFVEQAETLGDKGDLCLIDWSQYVTATKGGLKKAESIHLKFDYGQKAIRWTIRFDGQPRWRSALTPYKGSATTSPFVVLAARA